MKNKVFLSSFIKRFLLEYLISEKNLSLNTQHSYRDTLRLCLTFVATKEHIPIDHLCVEDITPEIIKKFLLNLEMVRHCSAVTRNQRLAAIRMLAQFIGFNSPEHIEWCRQIQLIPFKKTKKSLITYLEKSEMDILLDAPDRQTDQGQRDHALLLFLYNTGARADEAAQLTIADLNLAHAKKRDLSIVLIRGKGNKLRRCPLWQNTVTELNNLIQNRDPSEHVFLNRCGQPLTRFGIHTMVKRHVNKTIDTLPSIAKKKISPHTIRHTTATHLLQAGVDINTIRAWLGHVSINTTNVYAEINMEMKAKALTCCEIEVGKSKKHWRDDKDLMSFLASL